jgi:hypothetical protein
MVAIWLRHHYNYTYSSDVVRTIWGFYHSKKGEYYAAPRTGPINAKKCGGKVDLIDTASRTGTPYSSMPKKHNPLLSAFL